jgi:hypothetical protein
MLTQFWCVCAYCLLLLVAGCLQAGVELPTGADKRVHIHFMPGSCMTMVPVAAAAAADGDTAAAASDPQQQQQTKVCVVANIETETHVPEAVIHFVLRVRLAAAACWRCRWHVAGVLCAQLRGHCCSLLSTLPRPCCKTE